MKIRFITSNEGKYNEVKAALEQKGHELLWTRRTYPEIQTSSLDEVVEEGLEWLRTRTEPAGPFIIEDSGLFIDALEGFPGVFSAFVYKTIGNPGILRLMGEKEERRASFESRVGFWSMEKGPHIFHGSCPGKIAASERGKRGFGYDPIFIPEGESRTFAEITREEKHSYSHRGKAIDAFLRFLK